MAYLFEQILFDNKKAAISSVTDEASWGQYLAEN
jgi:hypothetical protein